MDCTDLAKIFSGEAEGDLDGSQDRAFTDHLSACEPCRTTLAAAEGQLDTLVELVEPEPLPAGAWDRVSAAIRAEVQQAPITPMPSRVRRRSPFPVFIAAAAAILFLVGVAFMDRLGQVPADGDGNNTTSHLQLPGGAAEATLVEAGEGFEAGYEVEGQLLCLWVRKSPKTRSRSQHPPASLS